MKKIIEYLKSIKANNGIVNAIMVLINNNKDIEETIIVLIKNLIRTNKILESQLLHSLELTKHPLLILNDKGEYKLTDYSEENIKFKALKRVSEKMYDTINDILNGIDIAGKIRITEDCSLCEELISIRKQYTQLGL